MLESMRDIIVAFKELGTILNVSGATLAGIERFVCNFYLPNTQHTGKLRMPDSGSLRISRHNLKVSRLQNLRFLNASKGLTIRL